MANKKHLALAVKTLIDKVGNVERPEKATNVNSSRISSGGYIDSEGAVKGLQFNQVCHGFMGRPDTYDLGIRASVAFIWATWADDSRQDHLKWCEYLAAGDHPWRKLFPDDLNVTVGKHKIYSPEFMNEYGFIFFDLDKFPAEYYLSFYIASRLFHESARGNIYSNNIPRNVYQDLLASGVGETMSHVFAGIFSNPSTDMCSATVPHNHWPFNVGNTDYVKNIVNHQWTDPGKAVAYNIKQGYNGVNAIWGGNPISKSYHTELQARWPECWTITEKMNRFSSTKMDQIYTISYENLMQMAKKEEEWLKTKK